MEKDGSRGAPQPQLGRPPAGRAPALALLICHRRGPRSRSGADGASPAPGRLPAPVAQSCRVRPAASALPSPREHLARPGLFAPAASVRSSAGFELSSIPLMAFPELVLSERHQAQKTSLWRWGKARGCAPRPGPGAEIEETRPQHHPVLLVLLLNKAVLLAKHAIPKACIVPNCC